MDGTLGKGQRWTIAAVAALLVGVLGAVPAARSNGDDGACRITGGYGAVFHDQALPDGSFAYRGVIILRTRSCGDGAKGVSGSFRPVTGGPATCTPVETPRIDESRCTFDGSFGIGGVPGMPLVIAAAAHTSGVINDHVHDDPIAKLQNARVQPGVEVISSECVVQLPEDGGRFGCSLF